MPTRLCAEPRCPHPATYRGRCQAHARITNQRTHDKARKRIYASKRWQLLRRRVLFEQPLCQCPDPDCTEIATDVDHIDPIEQGGDPWARSNLQALAHDCHSVKTRQEQATS